MGTRTTALACASVLAVASSVSAQLPAPESLTPLQMAVACASPPFTMTGDTSAPTGWPWLTNQILHTAIPIAALADWLLLTSRGRLHLRQLFAH